MIIYGVLAEVSIAKLFAAGVLPGLVIAGLYSGYIGVRCLFRPEHAPAGGETYSWSDRARGAFDLLPVLVLVVLVLGGNLFGLGDPVGGRGGRRWRPRSS